MNRREYMEQLAYLLQDIPVEECQNVLNYYEDYFDEGGAEQEEQIIRTLGSPERLAAMIKDGMGAGSAQAHGEYTDSGYRDERFREDDKVPQEYESGAQAEEETSQERERNNRNMILWLAILVIAVFSLGWHLPGILVILIIFLILKNRRMNKKN